MEMVVVYNAGLEAAKRNAPRIAPDEIPYPVFDYATKARHYEQVHLSDYCKREWLHGYDNWMKKGRAQ